MIICSGIINFVEQTQSMLERSGGIILPPEISDIHEFLTYMLGNCWYKINEVMMHAHGKISMCIIVLQIHLFSFT